MTDSAEEDRYVAASIMADIAPVRLCCGQRHSGTMCPDGLVMCCLCFERFPVEKLNHIDPDTIENLCLSCAKREAQHLPIGPEVNA
jgi:hypothetical protein